MTEDPNSNAHHLMSRSVASASKNWTCNLSSPRNESGIHGSGGMVGSQKDEKIEIGGFDSRETRRSSKFLRVNVSPDECLCRMRSGLNAYGVDGSYVTTRTGSGAIRFESAGEWVDMTWIAPPICCPDGQPSVPCKE